MGAGAVGFSVEQQNLMWAMWRRGFGVLFLELLDLGDDIANGAQAGQILVGDLHAVLVLGLHRDLHHRQRVDVQVVDERRLGG
jgi:hypothetical protein